MRTLVHISECHGHNFARTGYSHLHHTADVKRWVWPFTPHLMAVRRPLVQSVFVGDDVCHACAKPPISNFYSGHHALLSHRLMEFEEKLRNEDRCSDK